ncbi:MAG: hypothetical protein AAGI03_17170 [Pseudomonadota bacterium]
MHSIYKISLVVAALLPVGATAQDWSGAYGGAAVGLFAGTVEAEGDVDLTEFSADEDLDGEMFGLRGGYLFQDGTVVYGGEVGYYVGEVSYDGTTTSTSTIEHEFSIYEKFEIRGIIGSVLENGARVFGSLGYVSAETSTEFESSDFIGFVGDDNSREGFAVGVGYAQFVDTSVSLTAELVYTDLGEERYVGDSVIGTTRVDQDVTTTELRFGANYNF